MKRYYSILIASSNSIVLSTSFTISSSSFYHKSGQRSAYVHRPSTLRSFHQIYLQRPSMTSLHATNDDSNNSNGDDITIDPSSIYQDDATILPSYQPPTNNKDTKDSNSDGWGIADDWSTLSSGSSSGATSFDYVNNNYDTVINQAAELLEEHEHLLNGQWADAFDDEEESQSSNTKKDTSTYVSNSNEDFADTAIEIISSNIDYNDVGVALYDTKKSSSSSTTSATSIIDESTQKEIQEEQEMAYMIGCNTSPESYLISMGKALPELTDDVKYDPSLLLEKESRVMPRGIGLSQGGDSSSNRANGAGRKIGNDSPNNNTPILPLQPKMTPFFQEATEKMFNTHSINVAEGEEVEPIYVLDRNAIAKWMTTCLHSPFKSNDPMDQVPPPSNVSIGPHDPSVNAILSRYSTHHGSGQLTLDDFQMLYLEVAFAGYNRDIYHKKIVLTDNKYQQMPSIDGGVVLQGRKNTEKMLKKASLSIIWRDLEGHGIFSPAENEHIKMLHDMEKLQSSISTNAAKIDHQNLLMDECLLFDEYTDRLSNSISSITDINESDMIGIEQSYNEYMNEEKKKEKSSHQLVEFAYDGKTTKWIRDGEFVFIDEETCIGCTQCAQISPSSFKMIEDTGRARTYSQRNTEDVENAVMACPVNCMHYMSYDELKEMEVSRDEGDGRTDHRHFGGRVTHTPLHVAGRGSDANHKSSWYHYLKGKCHGSHSCPQRGCYDCPTYAPGKNPFFIERHKEAEHVRAKEFMSSGEADKWRKVVEL